MDHQVWRVNKASFFIDLFFSFLSHRSLKSLEIKQFIAVLLEQMPAALHLFCLRKSENPCWVLLVRRETEREKKERRVSRRETAL